MLGLLTVISDSRRDQSWASLRAARSLRAIEEAHPEKSEDAHNEGGRVSNERVTYQHQKAVSVQRSPDKFLQPLASKQMKPSHCELRENEM